MNRFWSSFFFFSAIKSPMEWMERNSCLVAFRHYSAWKDSEKILKKPNVRFFFVWWTQLQKIIQKEKYANQFKNESLAKDSAIICDCQSIDSTKEIFYDQIQNEMRKITPKKSHGNHQIFLSVCKIDSMYKIFPI